MTGRSAHAERSGIEMADLAHARAGGIEMQDVAHARETGRETREKRVLIYSHDTMGLGHLRRCRTIANALVEHDRDLSVLILSGSPIIGSFDFRSRVDFVRVPGVIKRRNGDYTSLSLHLDIEKTLELRGSIIRHTADIFNPHLFLVDKEPLGLRGEVEATLHHLRARGTTLILGLRDVLDDPGQLETEWERKHAVPALEHLYEEIWVYGLPQVCEPLSGIDLPASVAAKLRYTGYLRRTAPGLSPETAALVDDSPYILVTAGGGGDGEVLMDWVLSAYEHDRTLPIRALMVLGPFMAAERQNEFLQRAGRLTDVQAITFDARLESLLARAAGVVAMGGYNTFCEILSFDRPSILVPRTEPRLEQYIRAERAEELGLVRMLAADAALDPARMARALRDLPQQPRPSAVALPGLLDGLDEVGRLARHWLDRAALTPAQG